VGKHVCICLLGVILGTVLGSRCIAGDTVPPIEVRLVSEQWIEAEPGTILKASAVVVNNSGRSGDVKEGLSLPEGWEVLLQDPSQFQLDAGEQTVRLLVFHIPATFPAGTYDVAYRAESPGCRQTPDTVGFVVRVLSRIDLGAEIMGGSETVIAGETWRGSLKLTNKGNCLVTARVNARALPDGAVRVEPDIAVLSPSASDTITLTLETDDDLRQKTWYSIEIKVGPEAQPEGDPYARASVSINVVPRVTGVIDRYHRLPTEVELVAAMEEGDKRFQLEAGGSGTIDEAGNRRVGFLMRGPDIEDVGRYGRRDEYWFHYEDAHSDLTVGDRTYSMSPLTQRFVYGRGVQGELRLSKLEIGGLHVTNRDLTPKQTCAGGHLALKPHKVLEVRGNFLTKTADSSSCEGCDRSRVYSVETRFSPGNSFNLRAEYGFSHYDAAGIEDHAYRVESRGQLLDRLSYSVETVHAGPDYGGWYRGSDYAAGSVTARFSSTLRGRLLYNSQENSPRDTTASSTADRVRNLRCGLSCLSPTGLLVNIDYGRFERYDRLLPADHDFVERMAILGLGKAFGRFNLHAQVELGRVEDRLRGLWWGPFGRYSLTGILRIVREQTFIGYARAGHSRFTDTPERERSFGLSWRSRLGARVRFNIDFTTSKKNNPLSPWHHSLISNLAVDLPNGHSLSVRGHVFRKGDDDDRESALFLVYGIPARIPTARRKSTGSLKGRVYDAELAGRPPIAGVVLLVAGRYAVSGENGEFVFPAIEPGEHLLQIEQGSLEVDKTTTTKTPLEIEVDGGETTELEIGVVSACAITGEARLFTFKDGQPAPVQYRMLEDPGEGPADSADLHNAPELVDARSVQVIVEITNGVETLRQAGDTGGRFSFRQIRPGTWKIRFFTRDLPELYHLETDELDIRLMPGEERHVVAKALPKIRPIRMIDGGSIRLARERPDGVKSTH
jgi:hypothetical protein